MPNPPPTADELRERFDAAPAYTVGIEDEAMVLDPATFDLAPRAGEVLARLHGDARFKPELPASQVEILVAPSATVPDAADALLEGRRELTARAGDLARFACAGFHPSSPGTGHLNRVPRYEYVIREYGPIAERQLVCALQVHVSVPGADRALAVYNAARTYLPWLSALAANAPFYEGHDTGLASIRPTIGHLLPRQGIPPALESWDAYSAALAWGMASGAFPDASSWWYELRPHPGFGTLELRVPDAQATVADAAAIAAVAQALMAWLAERHDDGERPSPAPTWRIEQNRWSACRYGVEGQMADLETGQARPTRACLHDLLDALEPVAERLGAGACLPRARELVEVNGAIAQRRAAARAGTSPAASSHAGTSPASHAGTSPASHTAGWLASQFTVPWRG